MDPGHARITSLRQEAKGRCIGGAVGALFFDFLAFGFCLLTFDFWSSFKIQRRPIPKVKKATSSTAQSPCRSFQVTLPGPKKGHMGDCARDPTCTFGLDQKSKKTKSQKLKVKKSLSCFRDCAVDHLWTYDF